MAWRSSLLAGNPVDALAQSVLIEHGLSAASHVARQVTPAMISAADVVLGMDKRHLSAIHALVPQARGKTFLLGKWQGGIAIPDPYGQPRPAFQDTLALVGASVDAWCARL